MIIFPKNKSYFFPKSMITFGLPIASHSLQIGTHMSSTSHGSSTFYDTAQRCILSILSFFPQPIKTFGLSVLPSLEPKTSSTEHGCSTVYDIIFAGGGAAACVTAGRLAEADPSLKILVVETGPHTRDEPKFIQPGRYLRLRLSPTEIFTSHVAKPSPALRGRSAIVTSGRALGGGSSVNSVFYARAAASDYDDWENVYRNKGWGSKYLIPLLKKAETYQPASTNSTHGKLGPIKVSLAEQPLNICRNFLSVAEKFDKDRGSLDDTNAFFSCDGYGRWARYIDIVTGRRSDTAHHYIYNQDHNKNLKILVGHRVVRVIFEGTRAVGIEYVDDTIGRAKGTTEPVVALASRLVVLSAGAFGSPAILERSGIGSKDVLSKNNIPQLVDLPGVGEHYMDHNLISLPFVASEDAETLDEVIRGTEEQLEPYVKRWLHDGKGLMASNGGDAGIKMRPTREELSLLSPEFDHKWSTYFANAPDKPVIEVLAIACYGGNNPEVPPGKYFYTAYFTLYPVSVGRLHITAGLDPYGKLDFETGFLDDPADLVTLRWAYKHVREISRRMEFYRGEVQVEHPTFAEGSQAVTHATGTPVEISAPKIVYSKEDDDAIDEFHRRTVGTTWHSTGTCAMKPREQGGVVDERLNVYGAQNLKIADCSIAPSNVGANTYNTAIAIGEKAAVIIAEDLGINGVTSE